MQQNEEIIDYIIIPNFITKIKKSNKRRATYFTVNNRIPKKYQDKNKFDFITYRLKRKGRTIIVSYLTNLTTKERVIKNALSVGTESFFTINTNKLWSGFYNEFERVKLGQQLKEFYSKVVELRKVEEFPIYMEYLFYTDSNFEFDVDNLSWIYIKVFHDWLRDMGIIPDDNFKFISKYSAEVIEVEKNEDRKMIIIIKKHNRSIFLDSLIP